MNKFYQLRKRSTERKKRRCNAGNEPKEKYIGFATNSTRINVQKYAKRWGIETGYRMIESIRPRDVVPTRQYVNSVFFMQ